MVFPGVQKSTWTRDKQSGEYYFHRFYDFQPDLNAYSDDAGHLFRREAGHPFRIHSGHDSGVKPVISS